MGLPWDSHRTPWDCLGSRSWDFNGASMGLRWNSHGILVSPWGLPWDFNGKSIDMGLPCVGMACDLPSDSHGISMTLSRIPTLIGRPWYCKALMELMWYFHGTHMQLPWCSRGTPTTCMGFSWEYSAAGAYMTLPCYSHGIAMGFLLDYHAIPVLPWWFYETSIGLPWDFYGIFMGFSWDFRWVFMRFP